MVEKKYGTGLQEEVQPIRTYDYERAYGSVKTDSEFPSYYIIPSERLGVVKDQGSVGACVGCVVSSIAEVLEKMEAEKDNRNLADDEVEFSEGWAYGGLRDSTDNYYGMYVSKTLEYWRKFGIVPKKYFNYLLEMPEIRKKVEAFPELYDEALRYKIKSYANLNYAYREKRDQAIKEALYNKNYGLVSGSSTFFGEGHCIMLVGWNDEKNTYIFKNSWGLDWGNNGLSEIPKNKIDMVYLVTDEEITLPFNDVLTSDWFYGDVKNVYLNGLMNGITDIEFKPIQNMTRAEMATILARLIKMVNDSLSHTAKILKDKRPNTILEPSQYLIEKDENKEMKFIDVAMTSWYYESIKNAFEYNLIQGHSESIFAPEDNMTRAEVATVIVRIVKLYLEKINYLLTKNYKAKIGISNNSINFNDVLENSWYYSYVKDIVNLEIMQGRGDNIFEPDAFTTRAEIATIINRLNKYIDNNNFLILK